VFEVRFANTPIYDEAVREALLLHATSRACGRSSGKFDWARSRS